MAEFVLVHSPFLGPGSMRALADSLTARGHRVTVPDLREGLRSAVCHEGLATRFAATVPPGEHVIAGHSGAGPLLPRLARERPGSGLVYIDAGLPTPGRSWRDVAPAELHAQLAAIADPEHGTLPPWHTWFDQDPLDSEPLRAAIAAEEPRVPLRLLSEPRPQAAEPAGAYLRLSAPYDTAADEARTRGWPVRIRESEHLAVVTDPAAVAEDVEALARELA